MQYYSILNSNFTKNGDIKLKPSNAILKMELNGICEIEVEHPYDKEGRWKKIENLGVVKSEVCYIKDKQLFRIYDIDKGMFGLNIKARHIFFDLIRETILDSRAVNCNGKKALDIILQGTKFKGNSNISSINTAYFIDLNIISAIKGDNENSFLNRWKGEMWLDNFNITINDRIGKSSGPKIKYSRNMLDINLNENTDSIVTRAIPKAYDGKKLPEVFVDSPLIKKYPVIFEDFIDMSDLKLKDKTMDDDEGFETEEELYEAMRARVKEMYENGLDKPTLSGNVDVAALPNTEEYKDFKNLVNIGVGDVLPVEHKEIGVDIETRCIGFEWDILRKKYETMNFGELELEYFDRQDITSERLDNILNNNGSVDTSKLEGVINAFKAKFSAMRDIAQPSHVKAMIFEDRIKGSATYGAMCLGSMGFMIASERLPDDSDWDWRTFGSGQGFVADHIVTGVLTAILIRSLDGGCSINLETGEVNFNKGKIEGLNSSWDLATGLFKSHGQKTNGSIREFKIDNGKISSTDWLEFICKNLQLECDLSNFVTKAGFWVTQTGKTSPCFSVDIPNKWVMVGQSNQKYDLVVNGQIRAESVAEGTKIYNLDGTEVIYPVGGGDSSETQQNVINSARKLIGRPYIFGGNVSPLGSDEGTDCSGLMQWAYNDNGIKISRTTYTQISEGTEVSENELQPGDLVFSRFSSSTTPEHVFMYSGTVNGKYMCVEAQKTGTNIMEREFTWASGMRARRIIKDSSPSVPGGDATSKPSDNIIYFIKGKEGFAPNYYYDVVGVKTLGYGLTGSELNGITPPISEQQATNLLAKAFKNNYYTKVLDIVKAKGVTNAKQREIDAFASFAYNLGVGAFSGSTLLEKYVAGKRGEAIHTEFKKWVHAGGEVLPGLVTRREEEWKIFSGSTSPVPGYNSKPSIAVIGGSGVVTTNGGYGAKPQY